MHWESWLQLTAHLTYGKERWEGVGFWPLPTNPDDVGEIMVVACRAVVQGLKRIITVPTRPRLKVEFQVVQLGGESAKKARARYAKLTMDDANAVVWIPVGHLEVWGTDNGG